MGYFRLGLTSFSTISRELRFVEFFGLHIGDHEAILDRFDVSYVPKKNIDFNLVKPNLITVLGQ